MARRFSTSVPFSEGGTATLYMAQDLVLGRAVLLKVPHASTAEQIERTFREARALAAVHHPGVCQVFEVGFDDDRPFIALEKVEGSPLSQVADTLDLASRIEIVAAVAEAVQAIHEAGVIHRDLKPDNVVVRITEDGRLQPVVVDFGLVRFGAEDPSSTLAGTPVGTPGFMAPELVLGDSARVDARTDVYGLGALLYFVLTGRPVFEGAAAAEVMFRTLHEDPRPPREIVPDLPLDLQAIVLQCLDPDPTRRYPRAADVAADLRRHLAGEGVAAPRRGPLLRALRRFARSRKRVWAAAAIALALLGGTVLLGYLARHRDRGAEIQRFADDIEWRLRAEFLAPQHDITPHERQVREQIAELERTLPSLGARNRAHAEVALGRVWAALGDDEAAERHLGRAWEAGRNEPEVAYLRGLVLSRRYEGGLKRAAWSFDSEQSAARAAELARELRDPAREFLARAEGARLPVPEEYPHLLIAAHEGRYDEALALLGQLRQRVPWFYEAWITEGNVLQVRGIAAYVAGDLAATLASFEAAHRAYTQAKGAGQSDPRVHEAVCVTAADVLGLRQELHKPVSPEEITAMLGLCDEALAVSPERPATLASVAWAYEFAARSDSPAEISRERIEHAVDLARRAVESGGGSAPAHWAILNIALLTLVQREDGHPTPERVADLERTATALEAHLVEEPGSLDRLLLVHSFLFLEIYRSSSFEPPTPRLAELLRWIDELSATRYRNFRVPWELAEALEALSSARDVFGEETVELDDRAVRLAEEALVANPDMADVHVTVLAVVRARRLLACARLEDGADDRARELEILARLATLEPQRRAAAREAWRAFADAACDFAAGRDARPAFEAARALARRAAAELGPLPELDRVAALYGWRRLIADPRATRRERLQALAEPRPAKFAPTPQALLGHAQRPLTLAELALEAGADPAPFLAEAEATLAEIEARLPPEGRRPVALDRWRAVLAWQRLRAAPETPPGEILDAGRRVLDLPLTGTRSDLSWHFWRHQARRVLERTPAPRVLSAETAPRE